MALVAGLKRRAGRLVSPFPSAYPRAIAAPLVALQNDRVHALTPFLYLTVIANTIAMAVAVMGDLPWWQQALPPAIILTASLLDLARWRPQAQAMTTEAIEERLGRRVLMAGLLGLTSGIWGVSAFVETEKYYCVVAPVFVALSALVSANCMTSVPRAAMAAMAGALAPLVVKMLLFPNLGIRCMAVMLVLIGLLQSRLVLNKFAETVRTLVLQAEITALAESDALTGLKNRRAFVAQAGALVEAGRPVTLAMVDLDGFKGANDRHGHHAGDAVLIEVAQRMTRVAGSAACIARLGGDEFALVFDDVDPGQIAIELDALRAVIALPHAVGDALVTVGTSIGSASAPGDATTLSALMRLADYALYADKGRGARRDRDFIVA